MDRMSAQDASFLYLESDRSPMHVGGVSIFEGPAPEPQQFADHVASKLDQVPRYRQIVRTVMLGIGRGTIGVDVNINGRMRNGLMFQGGTSTGRAVTDTCDVTPKLDNPSQRFCRVVAPFATQFKGLMSYTIPKITVQVSSTAAVRRRPAMTTSWGVVRDTAAGVGAPPATRATLRRGVAASTAV